MYIALVDSGPSPVRAIAQKSGVNRGTAYDVLKDLMAQGLASYFNKQTKQYFAAEPPQKLVDAIAAKQQQLESIKQEVTTNLPELQALFEREGGRPQVKLYEGMKGIRQILEDVLQTVSGSHDKVYYVYSSSTLRKNVYEAMPEFTTARIAKKINVRTIALGQGGQLVGLDERKWLPGGQDLQATYELIYGSKVAHISLDTSAEPVGVIIDNTAIHETQKLIFENLWQKLE